MRPPARWLAAPTGVLTGTINGLTGSQVLPLMPYVLALDLDPRCAEAHYVRAVERHMAGDVEGAFAEYEKQLSLVEDPAALMNMALIYKGRGDVENERSALERAFLVAPWLEEPRRRLRLFERRQSAP